MFVVDLGFSSAKWISNETKGKVKSCFRKTKSEDGRLWLGERYYTGEKALLETGSHYLRTLEELVRFYPFFVALAAEKAGVRADNILAVGLPYDFYKAEALKEKKNVNNAIRTLREALKTISLNVDRYNFNTVIVYPQGYGGIKAYLSTLEQSCHSNILAIDIGFNTVISTLYSCSENEVLFDRTFYRKGIHDMAVNLLLPDIKKHFQGSTLTPLELNHVIEHGTIQSGFDQIDVRSEIDAAIHIYVGDLLQLIVGDLKATAGKAINFSTVVLFGGGARLMHGKIKSEKTNIVILLEPEYANARGFAVAAAELTGK